MNRRSFFATLVAPLVAPLVARSAPKKQEVTPSISIAYTYMNNGFVFHKIPFDRDAFVLTTPELK